jgi:hypothetical protein
MTRGTLQLLEFLLIPVKILLDKCQGCTSVFLWKTDSGPMWDGRD